MIRQLAARIASFGFSNAKKYNTRTFPAPNPQIMASSGEEVEDDDAYAMSLMELLESDGQQVVVVEGVNQNELLGNRYKWGDVDVKVVVAGADGQAVIPVASSEDVKDNCIPLLSDAEVVAGRKDGTFLDVVVETVNQKTPLRYRGRMYDSGTGTPNNDNLKFAAYKAHDDSAVATIMAPLTQERIDAAESQVAARHLHWEMLALYSKRGVAATNGYFADAEIAAFKRAGIVTSKKTAVNLQARARRGTSAASKRTKQPTAAAEKQAASPKPAAQKRKIPQQPSQQPGPLKRVKMLQQQPTIAIKKDEVVAPEVVAAPAQQTPKPADTALPAAPVTITIVVQSDVSRLQSIIAAAQP